MKILLSWLNDFVKVDDIPVKDIAKTFAKIGFEVEEIIDKSQNLKNVVTGKIEQIWQHPNADKLVVTKVSLGDRYVQIVTGAKNMKVGDIVPVALDGANLPCGQSIKSGELRGEKSEGMFCGYEEIGIDNSIYPDVENDGLAILKPSEKIGAPIAEVLGLNEVILDLSVLPNRPDCNSIVALAREIATAYNRPFKMPELTYKTTSVSKKIDVNVKNPELCSRYMGVVIENVKNGESPAWLKKRLSLVGHTPHNLFVDITNYVLVEIGQPMHAFDLSKIGGGVINVRTAEDGERISALNEKEYVLSSKNLVIADAKNPMVIAGVMGGVESGTFEDTQNVFLESAVFNYANIRRACAQLGLLSDSSIRYSKNVYFDFAELGLKRALHIIDSLNAGTISNVVVDKYVNKPEQKTVVSNVDNICGKLAMDISAEKMVEILNNLDIKTTVFGKTLSSVVPGTRLDIQQECDIVEEVGRMFGFDNIDLSKLTENNYVFVGKLAHEQENINALRHATVGEGFYEMLNYKFVSPVDIKKANQDPAKNIAIANPIGQAHSIMRNNLLIGGLATLRLNQKQQNKTLKMFELSNVFIPKKLPLTELPKEEQNLFLMTCNKGDFYALKESLNNIINISGASLEYRQAQNEYMHPGICADIILYNQKVGEIGKLHPQIAENFEVSGEIYIAEICLDKLLERKFDNKTAKPLPKFQNIERDIAIIVDKSVPAANILNTAKKANKTYIADAKIFDVYEGNQIPENCKSVAVKLYIRQPEKTMTEDEISEVVYNVIKAEEKENNASLRA